MVSYCAFRYGGGHEHLDTIDHFDKEEAFLVTEAVATDADMEYGQHYAGEHENKDTFSNLGTGPGVHWRGKPHYPPPSSFHTLSLSLSRALSLSLSLPLLFFWGGASPILF